MAYTKIEIFGVGCSKCKRLEENVKSALKELKREAEISKVTDIQEIAERGILFTPGLAIDGEIKVTGKVPDVEELKTYLGGK